MPEVRLTADLRTEFGKGGARRTRRAGQIPAVIYGHGDKPRHVALSEREFSQAIKQGGSHVLLTLKLDGKDQLTIPKAIQRDPIKGTFQHVDLLAVRSGEKVTVDVRLVLRGDVARGGLIATEHTSVSVEAEATHLPTEIEIEIGNLEIGAHVTAADLKLPAGSTLAGDPEQILLIIQESPTAADVEGDSGEAPVEEASEAEPEAS